MRARASVAMDAIDAMEKPQDAMVRSPYLLARLGAFLGHCVESCYGSIVVGSRRSRRTTGILLGFGIVSLQAAGCGSPAHPAELRDNASPTGTGPDIDAGGSGRIVSGGDPNGQNLVGNGSPSAPMCNLGPAGGVCACVDQPQLIVDPPNFFFILDRSGSMIEPWSSAAGTTSKWDTVVKEINQLVATLGARAHYTIAVFPDPSYNDCAPGVEIPISRLAGLVPNGGTPTAATLTALAPKIESLTGKTYVLFATDGGPNCNENANCTAMQCTYNIENDSQCPPNGPFNCCSAATGGTPHGCLDAAPSVAAVQAIAKAGVPVYVIGVPQSEPYAALLDELAVAGGTARGSEPQYYAASATDPSALLAALSKIAAKIVGTCTLTLNNAPPDPARVNVFFDGQALPQMGTDGWTLSGTTVTILGASCQKILDGDVLDVRVVGGCPTLLQ